MRSCLVTKIISKLKAKYLRLLIQFIFISITNSIIECNYMD